EADRRELGLRLTAALGTLASLATPAALGALAPLAALTSLAALTALLALALGTLAPRQERLAAELHLAEVVDVDDLDLDLVADLDDVGDRADEAVRQLGHVHEPFLAGQDLDEGAELLQAADAALVDLADLDLGGHVLDPRDAGLDLRRVRAADLDTALVEHRDAALELLLHAADRASGRADDDADLVHRDRERHEARRVLADALARPTDHVQHLAQDVQATLPRLLERLLERRARQALALDVHLQRGDALAGAGHLEVHVAAVVLGAEDVRDDRDVLAFDDEA